MENTEVVQNEVTPTIEAAPQTESAQTPSPEAAAPAEPQWVPNYKLKAYDAEGEIPEEFRSYINKDNELKFKDVFERSFAFDTVKQKYKDAHSKYQDVNTKYETVSKNLDKLSKFVQHGDFDSFFNTIKIPETAIQKWILDKYKIQELPPEQQSVYNEKSEYQRELLKMQEQQEEMRAQIEQFENYKSSQALEKRSSELDSVLGNADYKTLAESYDSRVGKPGSFRNEVILRAAAVANATGKDLSPQEAVQEFAKLVAWNNQNGAQSAQPVAVKQGSRPTIPSVSGKATSPVSPTVKTIDDLKRLAKEANTQG